MASVDDRTGSSKVRRRQHTRLRFGWLGGKKMAGDGGGTRKPKNIPTGDQATRDVLGKRSCGDYLGDAEVAPRFSATVPGGVVPQRKDRDAGLEVGAAAACPASLALPLFLQLFSFPIPRGFFG